MRGMLRFQLSRMLRCREFLAAMLLSCAAVNLGFVMTVLQFRSTDLSGWLSGVEVACIYGMGRSFGLFGGIWPFLVVLAFSTSFVEDRKSQCLGAAASRGRFSDYLGAKLLAAAFGGFLVTAVPLFLNLVLCYSIFPDNHNLMMAPYYGKLFAQQLLAQGRQFPSLGDTFFLLPLYLRSPFCYELMYTLMLGSFSALCAAAVTAVSFRFSRFKLPLFLPLYLLTSLTKLAASVYLDLSLVYGIPYFELNPLCYVTALGSRDCWAPYFLILCALLLGLTLGMLRWAKGHCLELIQR